MKPLRLILAEMTDPRRDALLAIYDTHSDLFHYAKGSGHNHQAWRGGYVDHIAECLRINTVTWAALNNFRPLGFTEDSAAIVLFFHDIEKPFRYGPKDHPDVIRWHKKVAAIEAEQAHVKAGGMSRVGTDRLSVLSRPWDAWDAWEHIKNELLHELMQEFDFELTADEMNALEFTHGEGLKHQKDRRVSCPLAAHAHHCDNASARIYFDDGKGLG